MCLVSEQTSPDSHAIAMGSPHQPGHRNHQQAQVCSLLPLYQLDFEAHRTRYPSALPESHWWVHKHKSHKGQKILELA